MTDIFDTAAAEIFEKRAAIAEFDGLLTRADAERLGLLESERWRRDCEVRHIIGLPLAERRGYLNAVEARRGKQHADMLRELVTAEWLRRKSA